MGHLSSVYFLKLPTGRGMVSSSVQDVARFVASQAPGRYLVEECASQRAFLPPRTRAWGWATKLDDGSVELEPDSTP